MIAVELQVPSAEDQYEYVREAASASIKRIFGKAGFSVTQSATVRRVDVAQSNLVFSKKIVPAIGEAQAIVLDFHLSVRVLQREVSGKPREEVLIRMHEMTGEIDTPYLSAEFRPAIGENIDATGKVWRACGEFSRNDQQISLARFAQITGTRPIADIHKQMRHGLM
jgi:hypothetical protein